ncbi:MAG: LPS export ABC transporter periplasmic protein LptC [Xanthobacteraceae bacterium]|nr:MAG: LPS export ABC transporter periplasmic protein LptC [Xanthobacteraceae bacterium]
MYVVSTADEVARAARFRAAARHSRRVRLLRVAIPVAVVAALAGVAALSVFNPWRMLVKLPLNMGNLVVSGTKITMEAPRLSGYTPDNRAYELSARAAAQDLTRPTVVELHDMSARIEMEDKSQVLMNASLGSFDTKSEVLTLGREIVLQSSTGYEGRLQEAVIDIRAGSVTSAKPVAVKLLNGTLDAKRLSITDAGALVRFDGGVAMTLMLPNTDVNSARRDEDK